MVHRVTHSKWHKSVVILATLLVVAIVLAASIYFFHKHNAKTKSVAANGTRIVSTIPSAPVKNPSSVEATTNASGQQTPPPSSYPNYKAGGLGNSGDTNLLTPSGTFVSDHTPSSSNFQEQSICDSTPGATCEIEFAKDGVFKQLSPRVTDANGQAYWTWNISSAGLDAGSWTITATATLNGQTKTAYDSLALVVPQ